MTPFFVNLPLKFICKHPEALYLFLKQKICPELGIDAASMNSEISDGHKSRSDSIRDHGLRTSVHMPFVDLNPGSLDPYIRDASIRRLLDAVSLAKSYNPSHIVVHSGYRPDIGDDYSKWLENSLSAWDQVLAITQDIPVYVENVYENDPTQLLDLLTGLGGRAGFCFDLGHWYSFGKGWESRNLNHWMQCMMPFFKHLHLHDNDGASDEHAGLGTKDIPFESFFEKLKALGVCPGFTLEPHTMDALRSSLDFLVSHKDWFALLGLSKKDFRHLERLIKA